MQKLFCDIETIGTSDAEIIKEIAATITPPANYTKPETIAAWMAERHPSLLEEAIAKTSFDGGLGKIIVFGMARDKAEAFALHAESETELLHMVCSATIDGHYTVVGHNVGWDVRFLWQRFVINGVEPPAWLRLAVKAKPWEVEDTMLMWNPDRDRKISLDRLCKLLGVPSPKGELDGSKVWDAYRAGKIHDIATYCCADVSAMRQCYWRMTA